jgi:hypothetical protein
LSNLPIYLLKIKYNNWAQLFTNLTILKEQVNNTSTGFIQDNIITSTDYFLLEKNEVNLNQSLLIFINFHQVIGLSLSKYL